MRPVLLHYADQHNRADINSHIFILAGPPGPGNAPTLYKLSADRCGDLPLGEVKFQHGTMPEAGVNGVTIEALLAVAADRLHEFQRGPYACEENDKALRSILDGIQHLKNRTKVRTEKGVIGTMEKHSEAPKAEDGGEASKARVLLVRSNPAAKGEAEITDMDKVGVVTKAGLKTWGVGALRQSWGLWMEVEAEVSRFDPKVTDYELSVLEKLTTTSPSKNGFTELKQALARKP